mmetsp:Transcript_20263/g.36087  ORF Transcript_20263/g.36087 Transcript_20263/m.36087 type:complete len:233 (+) Transcript_20263:1818-2516(+)
MCLRGGGGGMSTLPGPPSLLFPIGLMRERESSLGLRLPELWLALCMCDLEREWCEGESIMVGGAEARAIFDLLDGGDAIEKSWDIVPRPCLGLGLFLGELVGVNFSTTAAYSALMTISKLSDPTPDAVMAVIISSLHRRNSFLLLSSSFLSSDFVGHTSSALGCLSSSAASGSAGCSGERASVRSTRKRLMPLRRWSIEFAAADRASSVPYDVALSALPWDLASISSRENSA